MEKKVMSFKDYLKDDFVKNYLNNIEEYDYVELINNFAKSLIGAEISTQDIQEYLKNIDKDFLNFLALAIDDDCYNRYW
jgi:type IV secretory pathway component VirB8